MMRTRASGPLRAGARDGRSAESKRVAVGVGFDDGEQFGVRRGKAGEKTEVRFESVGANLNPARARCHGERQRSVDRGDGSFDECERNDGLVFRSDLIEEFGFERMRDRHLAGSDLLWRRSDEAEFAMAEAFGSVFTYRPNRRAEDAAGHGTPLVDAATAGRGVERGAGGFVGEVFKAGLIGGGCAERAGLGIAGKVRTMFGEPGARAEFDVHGERGICGAQSGHSFA